MRELKLTALAGSALPASTAQVWNGPTGWWLRTG
jgi:hypothetical protein